MQICYIIINPAWKEWCKIGFTSKSEMRTRLSTYQTGSPFRDFEVYFEVKVNDAKLVEKLVHQQLNHMCGNINTKNEWFKVSPKMAANIIETILDDLKEDE